jgi:hypothetical protein
MVFGVEFERKARRMLSTDQIGRQYFALLLSCLGIVLAPSALLAKKRPVFGLEKVALASLHPTQGAVGMHEVAQKRAEVEGMLPNPSQLERFLSQHLIPVVVGPGGNFYIIDHHHLGLALSQAKVAAAYVDVGEDLSTLEPVEFWKQLEADGKSHPYDETGKRIEPSALPATLADLKNDPYRDLAGAVCDAGGFAKTTAPFSEFAWADFFRSRISADLIALDFDAAVRKSLDSARTMDAATLPGFSGNH